MDGGLAANDWTMQFLADVLHVPVERPEIVETTALGAASLAGLQTGFFAGLDEVASTWKRDRRWEPAMSDERREELYAGWQQAVRRVLETRAE